MAGVAGDAARQIETASATPAQARLRTASAAFTEHALEAGWVDASGSDAARAALDVLIHGRGTAEASASVEPTLAEAFVAARALDSATPWDIARSLAVEIRDARAAVRSVNTAAAAVVLGPDRAAWARRDDVRAAEAVVQAARRTRTTFGEVSDLVAARLDAQQMALVELELAAFDRELGHLSAAADALSQAQPEVQTEQVDVIGAHANFGSSVG